MAETILQGAVLGVFLWRTSQALRERAPGRALLFGCGALLALLVALR